MSLRRWSSLSLRTMGLLVVALPVVPLACFWGVVVATELRRPLPADPAERNLQVQAGLARVLNTLLEADSGVRDYLLTDNRGARARYREAVDRMPQMLADLDGLVADPALRQPLGVLRSLSDDELVVLAGLGGEGQPTGAALGERASFNRSIELMGRIRDVIGTIEAEQMVAAAAGNAQGHRAERDMLVLLAVGSVGCTAAGVMAALFLANQIRRRHAVLADNVGRLARGEKPRPLPRGDSEVAWLDQQFRDAAAHLREREAELRRAVQRLEVANRELESFSYSVSHDLRAPLRAIRGFSQVLDDDWGSRLDDDGRNSLSRIRAAATRMSLLIDDLLALSRITRMQLEREHVDVSAVAHAVADELAQRAPDRSVDIQIGSDVSAEADPRMLRIALENLLENAWKFTKNTGAARVEVGVTRNGGPPVYYVRDNGAGFDMRYADRLFQAFQRLHTDTEFSGTGIGLTTVQRIVHRHGGRIWADATVNAGASFFFTLEPSETAS